MQDVSSPEAADPTPALPASHGPLWLWGLAALVVALSAAVIGAAWIAGARMGAPSPAFVSTPTPTEPDPAAVLAEARAALALREVAAEEGDAIAQYEVALAYLDGTTLPADTDRGIELLRRAAAQDYIPALMGLPGALADRVNEGSADPAEVFAALDKVIANPPDSLLLGVAHEYYGRYLRDVLPEAARNPALAIDHFVASLAAGNTYLARTIANAYRAGTGRPVDPVMAYAYFKVAQTIMPDEVGPTLTELEAELSPADLERAAALTLPVLLAREPPIGP